MVPDVEKIVTSFLNADPDVVDALGEHRVFTEIPANVTMPCIRVTLAGGNTVVRTHLYNVRVGLESYSGTKQEAYSNLQVVLTALENTLDGALVSGGVVSAVTHDSGIIWSPDNVTNMPRYLTTLSLIVHN